MHVLLLALNYWPDKLGNAPLMTGVFEGLAARGHRVSVVCAFPHHEAGRIDAPYRGKLFQRERRNGVDILRTYIYAPEGGPIAKMANYGSFTAAALAAASTIRGVDVVFTPSPPLTLGLVDEALHLLRGVPFVYNLQDLFPLAAVRLGMLTNPAMITAFEHLEARVYRKASRLSVISEGFRQHLLDHGVADDKIALIPNFTDTQFITPRPRQPNRYRTAHGLEDTFVVQFSGRMGHSQGLQTVVDAWRQLTDLDDLRLMMVGEGQTRQLVVDALAGDPRVTLLPTQARADLPDLLAAADVGLAPLRHGMAATSVPSKIYGIMAAGRPVIAGVDAGSDAERLVEQANCGRVVPPEDPDALARAIREMHADRDRARRAGERGRHHVERHHSLEVTIDRYEALLREVAAESAAAPRRPGLRALFGIG